MKVCVRVCSQQLTVNGIVAQQASRQTQAGTKHALMSRETRPIAVTVRRVTTLGRCRFKLRLTFNLTLFVQVPQRVSGCGIFLSSGQLVDPDSPSGVDSSSPVLPAISFRESRPESSDITGP